MELRNMASMHSGQMFYYNYLSTYIVSCVLIQAKMIFSGEHLYALNWKHFEVCEEKKITAPFQITLMSLHLKFNDNNNN